MHSPGPAQAGDGGSPPAGAAKTEAFAAPSDAEGSTSTSPGDGDQGGRSRPSVLKRSVPSRGRRSLSQASKPGDLTSAIACSATIARRSPSVGPMNTPPPAAKEALSSSVTLPPGRGAARRIARKRRGIALSIPAAVIAALKRA